MTDSNNKRIARNSIFMSFRMVIVLGISLYTTRAVLSVLGIVDYGVYNVVCGFVSMFAFLNTSMSNGIQRFYNFELGKNGEEGANRVYNMSFFIQLVIALVIIFLSESFGVWYINHKMVIPSERLFAANWVFQLSLASLFLTIMQAPYTAGIMAHERMDFYAALNVFDAVVKLVLVIALPLFPGDPLITYGFLYFTISTLNFAISYSYCKRTFHETYLVSIFYKNMFKSMLSFSGWNIFGSFANMMREQGINLVLNLFLGPVVNAARGVANQINGAMQGFVSNLTVAVRPQIIQSYAKGEIGRTLNLTYSISKLSCMFLYLFTLPVLLEIDFILSLWLGENIPEHTGAFVTIIVLTSFMNNLNAAISAIVHATGKMRLYQITGSFCILLAIPLAYVILQMGWSPEWALLSGLFSMVIAQAVALMVVKELIPFSITTYLGKVIAPILSTIFGGFWIPFTFRHCMCEGVPRLVTVGATSIISVSGAIYLFGLTRQEKNLLSNMLSSFILKLHKKA